LLALTIFLSASQVAAQSGTVIKFEPASVTIAPGATTVVNVRIENVSNLGGVEVHLTYNAAIVEVQQVEDGGFPPPDYKVQNSFGGGKIDYAIAILPNQHSPANGSGVLMKITFIGKAVGQSPLNFSSLLLAASGGGPISTTAQNGSITVSQVSSSTSSSSTTSSASSSTTSSASSSTSSSASSSTSSASSSSTSTSPGSGTLRLSPQSLALQTNNTGVMTVRIENPSNLWGVDLRLTYDATIVECTDPPDKGTVPKPDIPAKVSCGNGVIEYIVSQQAPTAPANVSGDALALKFKCLKAGTSPVIFTRGKLVDQDGRDLQVTSTNGQVVCSETPPPPTATFTPTPPGPTATPTATPAPLPSGSIIGYHTVRPGETVFCIARAYNTSPWAIVTQNNIYQPYLLSIGQVLAIPNVPWSAGGGPVCQRQFAPGAPTPTGVPPTGAPPPRCRTMYYVRYGDTLYSIAWRFGTTVERLAAANNLVNINWIFAGRWLCIP
jgi:LysM repeat protein